MLMPTSKWMPLVALILGLSGCTKTVANADAERKVAKTLSAQVGQKVTVKCPGKLEAKKGKSYGCTATAADGSQMRVRLTMTDDSGRFEFRGAGATDPVR